MRSRQEIEEAISVFDKDAMSLGGNDFLVSASHVAALQWVLGESTVPADAFARLLAGRLKEQGDEQ